MFRRKYPDEYLEILKNETKEIENYGVKIILKPSPGEEREGYLDPCEKAVMEEQSAGGNSMSTGSEDNEKSKEEGENQLPTDLITQIRDMMGFANYNLNTVEIYTKFETITDSGNEVGIWRYYPRRMERKKNMPALVFFHGGGFIGGSPYVVENFCKLIAEKANCVVFNIDYSLAPEKKYPNGLNDNYYAVKHIYENSEKYGVSKSKIAVAGDSAGGNYAAAISLKARDEGIPMIALQVLIYPVTALGDASVPDYKWDNNSIYIAPENEAMIRPFTGNGKPETDLNNPILGSYISKFDSVYEPYVSPMLAKSHENLPKAILVGAEFDGLRIQTEFYAKQLKDAGVDVTCYRYKGTTHAFIDKLGFVPQAEDLADVIAEELKVLNQKVDKQTYNNPILSGFYPDPSAIRVDKDYYLVTSTFEFFPGIPIFHSKNLVNWKQIGHCLTSEKSLPLENASHSHGLFAPTIRYHKGEFYMINTNMSELIKRGVGNFIVKTSKPDGEWSDPIWIDGPQGIDPSLLFDDDGKVYFCGTGSTEKGDAILLCEINPDTGKVTSEQKAINYGTGGKCPESPHIYKINDYYYLLMAEGGTEYGHMVTIQRSKDIWGPYEGCPNNPILSHRNYSSEPIQCVGHADLFEDHNGNWWMVCLGIRPMGTMLHQLGRETFLVPMEWKDGWPYPVDKKVKLEMEGPLPGIVEQNVKEFKCNFDQDTLPFEFNYIRNPNMDNYTIDKENSKMILTGEEKGLSGNLHSPTFIGIRQKNFVSETTVILDLDMEDGTIAGLTAYYMNTHHYDIRVKKDNKKFYVELNKRIYDLEGVVSSKVIEGDNVYLRINSMKDNYKFSYSTDGQKFIVIGEGLAAGLSTEATEIMTFTGTYFGIFAQNGVAKFNSFKSSWE